MNMIQEKIRKSSKIALIFAVIILAFSLLVAGNQIIGMFDGYFEGNEIGRGTYMALNVLFVLMQIVNVAAVYFVTRIFYEIGKEGKPFDMKNVMRLKLSAISIAIYGVLTMASDKIINYAYGGRIFVNPLESFNVQAFGCFVVGVMIFALALFFEYGCQLQRQSDETL